MTDQDIINVPISVEAKEQLKKLAKTKMRSMRAMARVILEEHLKGD